MTSTFLGTSAWFRQQWSNPQDIFTFLLLVGGDVVRVAIAQLCNGPVPYVTPVTFSFGWVTYAVSSVLSAVGDNKLLPVRELECLVINASTGYARTNSSWLLSRLLRDIDHWLDPDCGRKEKHKLEELKAKNASSSYPRDEADIRVALRVTVWRCVHASGVGAGDRMYWAGFLVATVQLGVAAIPWALYGEWLTFLVTAVGTALAFASGSLSQLREEKIGVRHLKYTQTTKQRKDVVLTEGNGAHDAILILGCEGGMDLEALASPFRNIQSPWHTRAMSLLLAVLWIAMLLSITGYDQHTWYLVAVGAIGMLHNVAVAGVPRRPRACGIDLEYEETIVEGKVMQVLWNLEERYPRAGRALVPTFFPGDLRSRERALWSYAERRAEVFLQAKKAWKKAQAEKKISPPILPWSMPPLEGLEDHTDVPTQREYRADVKDMSADQAQPENQGLLAG